LSASSLRRRHTGPSITIESLSTSVDIYIFDYSSYKTKAHITSQRAYKKVAIH
jgi:hypothetical protein